MAFKNFVSVTCLTLGDFVFITKIQIFFPSQYSDVIIQLTFSFINLSLSADIVFYYRMSAEFVKIELISGTWASITF